MIELVITKDFCGDEESWGEINFIPEVDSVIYINDKVYVVRTIERYLERDSNNTLFLKRTKVTIYDVDSLGEDLT